MTGAVPPSLVARERHKTEPSRGEGRWVPRMRQGTLTTVLLGVAVVVAALAIPTLLASRDRPRLAAPGLPTEEAPAAQRAPLPQVTLAGFGSRPEVALATYRGRPLVVNLWATWCAPCVEEMPAFQRVAATVGNRVAFLGVDVQDPPSRAQAFVQRLGITYDLAIDPERQFAEAVGAYGMPTTLLVDPHGTIVYRKTGPLTAEDLRRLLGEHLSVQA